MGRPVAVAGLEDLAGWAESCPDLSGPIFAGPEPEYGIGLETRLPDYALVSLDESPACQVLRDRGVAVCSLRGARGAQGEGKPSVADDRGPDDHGPHERGEADRGPDDQADLAEGSRVPSEDADETMGRSTLALLEQPEITDWIDARAGGGPTSILVFKSSHRLELHCRERGWRLLAAPAGVARRWENKVAFRGIAESLGLPLPAGRVFTPGPDAYEVLRSDLGDDFVVQAPHGFSGARTWRVEDAEDLARICRGLRARRLRASAFVAGRPLTLSACVTARGIAVSAPFCQLTGHPSLTRYPLGSCGNDWSLAGSLDIDPGPFVEIAERVGEALAADGFRGLFGLDFVEGLTGRPLLIEVNPRLVASVALHAQLEMAAGRVPLLARHVMALVDPQADRLPLDAHLAPLVGGQVILHRLEEGAARASAAPATGAYAIEAGEAPRFLRPALRVDELSDGEALFLAPDPERTVEPGQAWGRIQWRSGVEDRQGTLVESISAAVQGFDRIAGWEAC